MAENGAQSAPDWLQGAASVADGFRRLVNYLSGDLQAASQTEKLDVFRKGVDAIKTHLGPLTITREFHASFPGTSEETIMVFVGKPGPKGTPIVAFDAAGGIWTGSVEASLGITPDGRPVLNAFRANRRC